MAFHLFSQLPPELRQRIWLFSFGATQIIAVETYNMAQAPMAHHERNHFRNKYSRIIFKIRPAPLLVVNHEARDFFLPLPRSSPTPPKDTKLPWWFNFSIDSIWCDQDCLYFLAQSSWWLLLQRLTVQVHFSYLLLTDCGFQGLPFRFLELEGNSLKEVDFEQVERYEPERAEYGRHWIDDWISEFQDWHLPPQIRFYARITYPKLPEEKWLTPTNFVRLYHERMKLLVGTQDEDLLSDEESGSDLDDPVRYYARRGRIERP